MHNFFGIEPKPLKLKWSRNSIYIFTLIRKN